MKENEIRNREVFNKYLALVAEDVKQYLDISKFEEVACPACGSNISVIEFEKLDFKFVSCGKCNTLFANPRPSFEMLNQFYSDSPSTSFWVNEFFKPVADVRREKIFRPRAEFVSQLIDGTCAVIGDIGAGFGLFLDELKNIHTACQYIAIEPSVEMADICRAKGYVAKCACLESISDMDAQFDFLTAFELLEHLHNPMLFLERAYGLLKPGGRLYLTTLNGMGFDILVLWDHSKSVYPPHHLNFFNTQSIIKCAEIVGFAPISVETPGKLDWDIVEGMIKHENVICERLWNYFAQDGSDSGKVNLQKWIVENRLSSHMSVLLQK